jgi:hypothetical protein
MAETIFTPWPWWKAQVSSSDEKPLEVDARDKSCHIATLCSFAGHKFGPEEDRVCKLYKPSEARTHECLFYKPSIGWCDCTEK